MRMSTSKTSACCSDSTIHHICTHLATHATTVHACVGLCSRGMMLGMLRPVLSCRSSLMDIIKGKRKRRK